MDIHTLQRVAQAMVAEGKGILAIDESMGTCKKRFDALGIECDEENRRRYRQLLVTAPGIEQSVSGYILYDETLRQKTDEGMPFAEALSGRGIMPGIKVDTGRVKLALHSEEEVAEGLDGLAKRLEEYKALGATFAKWRAPIRVGEPYPSAACVKTATHSLARYAAICQEAGVVPIVEPEMLINGDHSIERCYEVTAQVLKSLFAEMAEQGVDNSGAILKVSMVISGKDAAERASVQEVAEQTVKCLMENVPADVAGVVFLSGGQGPEESTAHLDAMHKLGVDLPWPLSFSYGRAIQQPALDAWAADQNAVRDAQGLLVHRAKMNGLASQGRYDASLEHAA